MQALCHIGDMDMGTAIQLGADQERPVLAEAVNYPAEIDPLTPFPARISPNMLGQDSIVLGMLFEELARCVLGRISAKQRERHRPLVVNENILRVQIDEAALLSTEAKVVLLAVSFPETHMIKQPDSLDRGIGDVHAEADTGRYDIGAAGIDGGADLIKPGSGNFKRNIIRCRVVRITEDGRVVGIRREGRNMLLRLGMSPEPVDPVMENDSVAVQKNDILFLDQRKATVDRRGKAEVCLIDNVGEAIPL